MSSTSIVEEHMKILMVGDARVGKTSIARRLAGLPFSVEYFPSEGQKEWELSPRRLPGHAKAVSPVLWDVAASEMGMLKQRGRGAGDDAILSTLLKGTAAVMFVFDLGSSHSLRIVDMWHSLLEAYLEPRVVKALIGHKADTEEFVVDQHALDEYVAAAGFHLWCSTVGSGEFGDYNVGNRKAARKGKWTRVGDSTVASQKAILARQLSVWELLDMILREALVAQDEAQVQSERLLALRANVSEIMPQFDKGPLLGRVLYNTQCRRGLASRIERQSSETIQSNDILNSFSGNFTRENAEALLRKRTEGSYLLRRGNGSNLVLSISGCGHSVHHVVICSVEGGYMDEQGNYGPFATLDEFLSSVAGELAKHPIKVPREGLIAEEGMMDGAAKVIKDDVRRVVSAIEPNDALDHESSVSPFWKPRGSISCVGSTTGDALPSVAIPFHSNNTVVSNAQANRLMAVAVRVGLFTSSCLSSLQDMGNTDTVSQLVLLLTSQKDHLLSMVRDIQAARPDVAERAAPQQPLRSLGDQSPEDSCAFPAKNNPVFRPVVAGKQRHPSSVRAEDWFHILVGFDKANMQLQNFNQKQKRQTSSNLQWSSRKVEEVLTELENLVELSASRWNRTVNCLAVSMRLTEGGMNGGSVIHSRLLPT